MRRWAGPEWRPVPAARAGIATPFGALVGESPAGEEVDKLQPFVGKSGQELNLAIQTSRVPPRTNWIIDNVIACRAPKDTYDLIRIRLRREKAAKLSPEHEQHPAIHCRPRLLRTLRRTPNIVPLGKTAAGSVLGEVNSILAIRGGPITISIGDVEGTIRVLPTLHPAFVRRSRRWRQVLAADLRRAARFFTDSLDWIEPNMILRPTLAQMGEFFAMPSPLWAYDLETDALDTSVARIRCLAITRRATPAERERTGSPDTTIGIPIWSMDFGSYFYDPASLTYVANLLRTVFTDGRLWTGWNSGYYDRAVIERILGVVPKPHVDGILLHRLNVSELPHGLGVAASIALDVTNWKQDNEGEKLAGTRDDAKLLTYCCLDSAVTSRLYPILASGVAARRQDEPCPARPSITLAQLDHRIQEECLGMHRVGMCVDQAKRQVFENEVTADVAERRKTVEGLATAAGWKGNFNPASWQQVSKLLYDMIGLDPVDYTGAGDPSTDDDCLREHLMDPGVQGLARVLIIAQRAFRKKHKVLTSFVHPMRPVADGGLVGSDGRLHANWSAHRTVSGRLASSNPNCFDEETEVLTRRDGWRFLADLINKDEMNHNVAQWSEDGSVAFVRPTAWIKQHFKGDLVHLHRQRDIDMLVTPDHRCVVETRQGRRDVVVAENYPPDHKQLHGGVYAGGSRVMDSAFLRLVCAVQADAHATKHRYGWSITFRLTKRRKIERLRSILADLADRLDVKEHWEEGRRQWYIRARGAVVDDVMDLLTPTKHFGPWLLSLPGDLLDTFCIEVFHWDGCFTRMNHYSSEWKVNAVWVQTILALRGHRANLRVYTAHGGAPNWQVDVLWNKPRSWTTNVERTRIPHDGPVYCLSVPSSFVLIRRNGRIQVTGQCQNQPKVMRKLIVPGPGHILVGADADQLEFRIAAARWHIKKYLEAFALKLDPHQITMLMAFGEAIWAHEGAPPCEYRFKKKWPGGSIHGAFNRARDLGKRFQYGGQYGANDKTKWGLIREAEDEHGNLVYAHLKLAAVQEMSQRYFAQCPELPLGWKMEEDLVKGQGCGIEPITGRRRDFLDGPERNEIANHPIQGSAAGIVNLATIDVTDEFPSEYAGPGTGLIQQGHDALVLEVLEKDADRACALLQRAMAPNYRHILDVEFSGEASKGRTWYDVC